MPRRAPRGSRPGSTTAPGARDPRLSAAVPALALAAVLAGAIGADVFRLGFFADDFHFLDVARRVPLWEALAGRHGIWPWYRPVSRELFFWLVTACGRAAPVVAHVVNLACVLLAALLLWRVGRRLVPEAAALVAPALFLAYGFTKFLAAWSSGFQDVLAVTLTLAALELEARDRRAASLACAMLACFAKETGILAFVLLFVWRRMIAPEAPRRARGWDLLAGGAAVLALHWAARASWPHGLAAPPPPEAAGRLARILGEVLGGFVAPLAPPPPHALGLALLAGAGAAVLCVWAQRAARDAAGAPERGVAFVVLAVALGLAPLVLGHVTKLTFAHAYHAFPAAPWLALALAALLTRLPAVAWQVAIPLLVAWNAWGLAIRPVDLEQREAWRFRRWDWTEATRIAAVSRRLEGDLVTLLAQRPDSLVVLYEGMPQGCFFQTEDGPATREALRDRGVRAYWVNDPAPHLTAGRIALLEFDTERFHLAIAPWSQGLAIHRAMNAIVAGRGAAAEAFTLYGAAGDSARFDRDYLRAAATLLEDGPAACARRLAAEGLGDSLGAAPDSLAEPVARADPRLGAALAGVLRRPLGAASHAALAAALLERGVLPRAALELRIAVTLDPGRREERYRLAELLVRLGGIDEARTELRALVADPDAGPLTEAARRSLAELPDERGAPAP